MIPPTLHGMNAMTCISSLQKCIRRSMEAEAMAFAVELMHSSRGFFTMTCNRIEVVSHEDIDCIAAPHVVVFVATCIEQSKRHYDPAKIGASRLFIGNAIRAMCAAPKSRAGTHFAAAIGLRAELEDYVPEVPDFAHDQHTLKGRRMGRGLTHFRNVGAVLIPPPTEPDRYEMEAYRLWTLKEKAKRTAKEPAADLFNGE